MSDENLEKSTVPEEETDFEAAFTEHAEARELAPEDEPEENLEPEDKLDEDKVDLEGKQDHTLTEDSKKEEEDLYAGMSDETKARVVAMEEENKNLGHRLKSDAGRVSALQLKINGLEKDIQGVREGGTTGSQPSTNQIADAMKGSDEDWDQFSADYPEVAKAIDSRLDQAGQATQESIEQTLAPVKERQARDDERAAQDAVAEAAKPVTELYPLWTEAVKNPDFALWLDTQPPGVQSLAGSDDAEDAVVLIERYDNHLVANGQPTLKAESENVPTTGDEPNEKQTKLAEKRKQQLEDGTTIKSKNTRIDPSNETVDEFEAAFNYHAKRRERQRATG